MEKFNYKHPVYAYIFICVCKVRLWLYDKFKKGFNVQFFFLLCIGTNSPVLRKRMWQKKRVFFLTPQVLVNDLVRNICPASSIKCVVVDEAHKALGNHAYCQVNLTIIWNNNKPIKLIQVTMLSDFWWKFPIFYIISYQKINFFTYLFKSYPNLYSIFALK